jgi:hypothetical protein
LSTDSPPKRRRRRAFDWSTAAIAALSLTAAGLIYWRDGAEHFIAILGDDMTLVGAMLPKVLAGCLIGAFVTLLLPRELVARWVGHESGFPGLAIAAFFGFLLPGGPITIYPVAGAFLAMGADAGGGRLHLFLDADRLYPRAGLGTAVLRYAFRALAHRRGAAAADRRRPVGARGAARGLSLPKRRA